jgi:hypothetical protein
MGGLLRCEQVFTAEPGSKTVWHYPSVFQSVPVTSMSNGFRWSGASSFYRDCALVLSGLAIR